MPNPFKMVLLLLLLLGSQCSFAQDNKEKAYQAGMKAIKLEDDGKYEEALALLFEAEKLDSENAIYPYEVGYAYYAQKEYPKAMDVYKKLIAGKSATDQCFQMLGNIYDLTGDSAGAMRSYNEGLKMFPKSGKLFLEKGNVYWNSKEYNRALPFYEQGIKADPAFPSNYYRATRIYCASSEQVFGMVYGEIFMNLERNSKRTVEISKMLYNTYVSQITIRKSKGEGEVRFSKNNMIVIRDSNDIKNPKLPFGVGAYEITLLMSITGEKAIDLSSLDRIRRTFTETYFKNGIDKKYPNVLFDYQQRVLEAGHMEAYNHWILMQGDLEGFNKWQSKNKEQWAQFVKWFEDNKMALDDEHKFCSDQY